MKKTFLTLIICLGLSVAVFAQKTESTPKVKIAKALAKTWVLQYATNELGSYPTEYFNQIKLVSKAGGYVAQFNGYIAQNGDSDWGFYPSYDYTVEEGSYEDNPTHNYQVVAAVALDKTKGGLVLQRLFAKEPSTAFIVLLYRNLGKESAAFEIKSEYYSIEQAKEVISEVAFSQAKLFVVESVFSKYKNLPVMPAMNEQEYLVWWDAYMKTIQSPDIAKRIFPNSSDSYQGYGTDKPGLAIADNSYIASKVKQDIFLARNFNPYKSTQVLKDAYDKYGFNEAVKEKIRGPIARAALDESRAKLNDTWYYAETRFSDNTTYLEEKTFIIKENELEAIFTDKSYQNETKASDNIIRILLPCLSYTAFMDAKEGVLALGPLPDSLAEGSDNRYVTLGFKLKSDGKALLVPQNSYSTPEEALLRPFDFSYANTYVNEALYKKLNQLPELTFTEETYKSMKEEIDQISMSDYSIMVSEILFAKFEEMGFNPYKCMKNYYEMEQAMADIENAKNNLQYIEDYKGYITSALESGDTASAKSYQESIDDMMKEQPYLDLKITIRQLIKAGADTAFISQKNKELKSFNTYKELKNKLYDAKYKADEIRNTLTYIQTEVNNASTDAYSFDYYKNYYENAVGEYLATCKEDLAKWNEELNLTKAKQSIAYVEELQKKAAETQKYVDEQASKDLQTIANLLQEWEKTIQR
jgi:hypothetical protein